jgi:hypothetical protein
MKKIYSLILFVIASSALRAQSPAVDLNFPEPNNQTYAVAYDSVRNSVYIGGEFTIVGTSVRTRFASLNASTGALQTWNPAFSAAIFDFKIVGHYLYAVGSFTSAAGSPRNHMAKFDLYTNTLTSWNPAVTGVVTNIDYDNGMIYAGNNAGTLYRIDTANTATIDTWQPVNDGYISDVMIANGYLYVAGSYSMMDGQARSNISAFDLSTSPPTLDSWAPEADNRCNNLAYYNGNVYVSGFYTAIGGAARTNLAEVTAAETGMANATSWDPSTSNEVNFIRVKGNQLYYFDYPNPLREVYLPTHTATTWSVTFGANIGWNTMGFDFSATQVFFGGGWNLTVQGASRKNFAVLCARPYSPIIDNLSITTSPSDVCHGASGVLFEAQTGTGATSYTWTSSPSESITSYGDSAHINFSTSSTVTAYTVSVTGSNGCISTNTATTSLSAYTLSSYISAQMTSMTCGDKDTISVTGDNYIGSGMLFHNWSPSGSLNHASGDTVVSSAKNDVTYKLTTTSSEGCVGKDSISISVNPFNVNLSHTSQNLLCSEKDTISLTNDYPGLGTLSYTWSPSASLNLTNPIKVVASPTSSTTYSLDVSSSDGCSANQNIVSVNVQDLTVNASSNTSPITCGNTTTLTASSDYPGTGILTYTWSPSDGLSNVNALNPVASPTTTTDYTLTISSPEGCVSSDVTTLNVDPLQINVTNSYSVNCHQPVVLNTSANTSNTNLTYSWTPATGLSSTTSASPTATIGVNTTYNVTMSLPASGCSSASNSISVSLIAPSTPNICMVTVDSASTHNIIYWDKTGMSAVDSFRIYREITTFVYQRVGSVPYSALSEFHDYGADPNTTTYRYKLTVLDSCGNESPLSNYHNTIYIVSNNNGQYTWNPGYTIENNTNPVNNYILMRDDYNTGAWHQVAITTGNQNTIVDPNYSSFAATANWQVVTAWNISCNPTARQSNGTMAAIVKSKSNISNNRTTGLKSLEAKLSVYPNPTNGLLNISLPSTQGAATIKITSLLGEEVYSETASTGTVKLSVDMSKFQGGVYLVQVTDAASSATRRIVKN